MSSPSTNTSNTPDSPQKRTVYDYVELIETVARVEYSRLPNHLIDYSELVNIGAIAVHVLLTQNPGTEYNITYISTAIKWAVRNELRYRYKWYSLKQTTTEEEGEKGETEASGDDDDVEVSKEHVREAVYETILSSDALQDAENPMELKDGSYTPEENSEVNEMAKIVRESIAKLPERERQILEARFYKNMKMREIGAVYNISPSRISRILQTGLDKVKRDLQRRGYA
jgi:RNA polymerase sigma factor (sigma-70 family)